MRRTLSMIGAAALAVMLTAGVACDPRPVIIYQGPDPQDPSNDSIIVADQHGDHVREVLTGVDGRLLHPDWTQDGRSIAFSIDGGAIWLSRDAGATARLLVPCAVACSGVDFPAFAPDGRTLAYTRYVEPGPAGPPASSVIVLRDLRSGDERIVARSAPGQVVDIPRWSPDGTRLAIGIDRFDSTGSETGSAIAIVDLRTRRTHRLTAFERYAYAPDWNPRSDELVFSVETLAYAAAPPSGPRDLFLIRADGTRLRRLTHVRGERMVWQPAFAPDGRSIVATLDEPGARRGVRVAVPSGSIVRLGERGQIMTHLKVRR